MLRRHRLDTGAELGAERGHVGGGDGIRGEHAFDEVVDDIVGRPAAGADRDHAPSVGQPLEGPVDAGSLRWRAEAGRLEAEAARGVGDRTGGGAESGRPRLGGHGHPLIMNLGCDTAAAADVAPLPYGRSVVLNPAQQRVVDDLLARGAPRPSFAEGIDLALLSVLEDGLSEVADRLDPLEVHVNKTTLGRVLACETLYELEAAEKFRWTVATARGVIAHRAIELAVFASTDVPPLQIVDDVIERIAEDGDDRSPRDFLRCATAVELSELRGAAAQIVTSFESCFPPLKKSWRPRVEAPCRVSLCADRIVLRAKVDLALGRAIGNEARVLIVDMKTGGPWPAHLDDLRYYALCETLRSGVPPFRIATYYLESARWQHEDVTVDLLESAARRVVAGVTRLADLHLRERPATWTTGPACTFCRKRDDCAGGREWAETRVASGVAAA